MDFANRLGELTVARKALRTAIQSLDLGERQIGKVLADVRKVGVICFLEQGIMIELYCNLYRKGTLTTGLVS